MLTKLKRLLPQMLLASLCIYVCMGLLDLFWLGWAAADTYQTHMQGLLREQFITWPWIVFYLLYGAVILVLCVIPNTQKPAYYALIDGAFLGLASYGAYNLTTYSILQGFTLPIMLIDWVWGVALTAISALAGWYGFALRKVR